MSAAPVATGMPGGRPSSAAGPGSRAPDGWAEPRTGGSLPRGRPSAAMRSSAQASRFRSYRSVPEASVGSVAACAGQLQPDPVLGLQRPLSGGDVVRLVLCQPAQDRAGHAGRGAVAEAAGERGGELRVAVGLEGGALVEPQDRRPHGRRGGGRARRRASGRLRRRRRCRRLSPGRGPGGRRGRLPATSRPGSDSARPADGTRTGYSARPRPSTRPRTAAVRDGDLGAGGRRVSVGGGVVEGDHEDLDPAGAQVNPDYRSPIAHSAYLNGR